MVTTKYPIDLDTDAELPRVEDNITEIGGECINALRAAVFAIEKALGRRPQGTATDLVTRLGVSLDNNGNIKASALSSIGLVTLPITNIQVGSAAGIEESKLDLNYNTVILKTWIDSLRVRVDALETAVAQDIANLGQHIAGLWGRHTAGHIDAYGVFIGFTVQGALTNLDTRLNAHIVDPIDAHDGSAISLDVNRFAAITATDVQSGIEQLENIQLTEITHHRDRHHGNGILGTQDAPVSGTQHGAVIISAALTTSGTIGDTFISFSVAPVALAFQSIARNDHIDLLIGGKTYSFVIESIQSTNRVNIFGSRPVAGIGMATVYHNMEETIEPSVAMVCLRRDALGSAPSYDGYARPSTIQTIHPSSPYVLSSGFRGCNLSATVRNLKLTYPSGNTGDMDIYAKMLAFSTTPSTWTVENVARVINASLFAPGGSAPTKHPLIAFAYKGELGIAYEGPEAAGSIGIGVPLSNDATTTLGFVSGTVSYASLSRNLYIDGYEFQDLSTILDARGKITAPDTITFPVSINLLSLGVRVGHLARISLFETGSYIIQGVSANALTFDSSNEHDFTGSLNQWVRVCIFADAFSVSAAPSKRTLYEVFLDGYDDGYGPVAGMRVASRIEYSDTIGSLSSLEAVFDVTAVSRTFIASSRRLFFDQSANTVVLGTPAAGPSISNIGVAVTLPASNHVGFCCSVYDGNGVDYIDLEIASAPPVSDGYLDVSVLSCISEERFLQVATVLHNKTTFKHLSDTRQFGNVGRQDVRDDFTRDYVSYPRSLLRGNGVIYGFVASGVGTGTLTVTGGQALINGQLKSVPKATFIIPADGVGGNYNLFLNSEGVINLLRDDFASPDILSTPSLAELLSSKTETALTKVTVNGTNNITVITDVRRFVGDIDSKLDLLVEENNITHGSFASLAAAIAYIEALPLLPVPKHIKIRGNVLLGTTVILPENTVLEGVSRGGGSLETPTIIFTSSSVVIDLSQGCQVRNLKFYRSGTLTNGFLDLDKYTTVDNCWFEFVLLASGNNAIIGSADNTKVTNCFFKKAYTALYMSGSGIDVSNNIFDGCEIFLTMVSCGYANVSGNIVSVTLSTGYTFLMTGCSMCNILGNIFVSDGNDNLFSINGTTTNSLISGNLFQFYSPSAKTIIFISGSGCIICNNKFDCSDSTGGYPLSINGNNNLISGNSFSFTVPFVGPCINDVGLGNVDTFNKGQEYTTTLQLSKGMADRTYPGWTESTNRGVPAWENVTTNDGYCGIQFGTPVDVPAGALVSSIKVYYDTNEGGANRLACFLCRHLYNTYTAVGTALSSTHLNGTGTVNTSATLNLPVNFYIDKNYAYTLVFQSTGSVPGQFIFGIELKYVL
jgi:hypothetical protein